MSNNDGVYQVEIYKGNVYSGQWLAKKKNETVKEFNDRVESRLKELRSKYPSIEWSAKIIAWND